MTKKLFVVLVVVIALIGTISWAVAAKKGAVGVLEKYQAPKLMGQQSATPMPSSQITEPLTATPFVSASSAADRSSGFPYAIAAPGDILWHCNIGLYAPPDSDFQMLGVETLRDTIYATGGNNGVDPNRVYVWLRTGGTCQYLYKVDQLGTTGWGLRDLAADNAYLYASAEAWSRQLRCFYVTPGGMVEVPGNHISVPASPITLFRAIAYDPTRDWFWSANFASSIVAFNRAGTVMATYANTYALYGMAVDTLSTPGQAWLWCYSQDSSKVRQFDMNTGTYTGLVYSAYGEGGNGTGIAGGLCMLEGNPSLQGTATLLGLLQGTPCDEIWAMDIAYEAPEGCCQFATYCDILTEADCITGGGTWHPDLECINDVCQLPIDTTCHLQWDNGSAAWYASDFGVGSQQGNYFNPETMCPDCGPDVYPFLISQVSGIFYDFAAVGFVDVIVHIYSIGPDTCSGPGAEIYQFPATITTFYPTAAVVPLPEVLCVEEDFIVAFELNSGTAGSIPCVLWTSEAIQNCISWIWHTSYSPPWYPMEDFWSGVGYHMIRVDGVCNSGACAQGVECNLIQDGGHVSSYFGGLSAGDQLAKYFDPEVYCTPPVYPYHISDVELLLYDFAGVGTVNLRFGVNTVCHDSCDGPGTQIYRSDPITVTTMYPSMAHIDLPDVVCVYEPFFIVVEWASGSAGSTPSFLMEGSAYPCDTCHAWMWYTGYSPPWWEWSDFWSPPVPGCPIVRVSGFTEDPLCAEEPCDTTLETLYGGPFAYYIWRNPSRYGHFFVAERFQLPMDHGGRLDRIEFAFYTTGTTGTPDPDFYVWFSDGVYPLDNNPPYQAIGDFHKAYSDIVFYPSWMTVDTWDRGIMFDPGEKFHIGYGHAFDPGDTLVSLSDDGSMNSDRSSQYYPPDLAWETILDGYGVGVDILVNAVICPYAPPESTFTIACSPYQAFATPGDPPAVKFQVDVGAVLGYALPVTLSCTPPAGINVSFATNPVTPPGASDVTISVDPGTTYGDYTLTFCGLGSDGQGPKCCDVILTVEPPYDEALVDFYHGKQRATNFGAVGNDAAPENFVWYGMSYLFDGTFIIATTDDAHMALDVYNCVHVGWLPSEHMDCYYDPVYNANICYANFFTPESVISCEYDSVFIVGIMEECVDFSIKIKVYYNPDTIPIYGMYMSLFEDWDVGDAYNNWGDMDPAHNIMYQFDPLDPNIVFGMMKAPFYDDPMYNMWIMPNPFYVWPGAGFCGTGAGYLLDDLYGLISTAGYGFAPPAMPDTDYSMLMTAGPIDLLPGEKHIEVWIDFGRNTNDGLSWSQWWHRVLRYAGFYRGDVNASDTLELPALDVSDLVYLMNYLFAYGPDPDPYADQGDVNADGIVDVQDVVYLLNYIFKYGPAPIDYLRFIPQKWTRPSLFENPNWQ